MDRFSRRHLLIGSAAMSLAACARGPHEVLASAAQIPIKLESFESEFADIVDTRPSARVLGQGYKWAEGPAWDAKRQSLYFTDVPENRAYQWREGDDVSIFLEPSGVARDQAGGLREPGANGLLVSRTGELLICNHGKRAVEAMAFATKQRRTLAQNYKGKRFSSPNDVIEAADGTLYFTDPPYGMEGLNDSPLKELTINGVYRLDQNGQVTRLVDNMTYPNGVALSPDQSSLYIAQSDPDAPLVRKLDLAKGGNGDLWFDARPYMTGHAGLPDGMAVTTQGHVFLAGPGGVLVINPAGKCLGRIGTGRASANCTFGEDGKTLFITAQDRLIAVRTKVTGLGQF